MKTLVISNQPMDGIMKIVKSLEDCGLLEKGVRETIKKRKRTKMLIS